MSQSLALVWCTLFSPPKIECLFAVDRTPIGGTCLFDRNLTGIRFEERYAVKHHDFILFMPTIDETTLEPLPEEERPQYFIVAGKGNRQRWVFWDSVTAIDLDARENGDRGK
jgi:hypothetical protein